MQKLNQDLLNLVKRSFVPMPGGQAEPVAGAGQMTAGLASGGIGAPPGAAADPNAVDPNTGMPAGGDPAAMGGDPAATGAPADPNAGGQMPPEMLAALSGTMPGGTGGGVAPGSPGTITLTVEQLIQLVQAFGGGAKKKPAGDAGAGAGSAPAAGGAAPDMSGISDKLDKILQAINPPSAGASMSASQPAPAPGAAPMG